MGKRLGTDPLPPGIQDALDQLNIEVDKTLNGDKEGDDRVAGFVLAIFPYFEVTSSGSLGLLSNADDVNDVLPALRKMVRRIEREMKKREH